MGVEQGFKRIRGYKHMLVLLSMLSESPNNKELAIEMA